MVSAQLLIAQQVADDTGRTIRLIILALLGVALLLAVLTTWYWRHTDPRRRLLDPFVEHATSAPGAGAAAAAAAAAAASATQSLPTAAGQVQGGPGPVATGSSTDADDGADEWLRLTGPQALRRSR